MNPRFVLTQIVLSALILMSSCSKDYQNPSSSGFEKQLYKSFVVLANQNSSGEIQFYKFSGTTAGVGNKNSFDLVYVNGSADGTQFTIGSTTDTLTKSIYGLNSNSLGNVNFRILPSFGSQEFYNLIDYQVLAQYHQQAFATPQKNTRLSSSVPLASGTTFLFTIGSGSSIDYRGAAAIESNATGGSSSAGNISIRFKFFTP